MRRAAFAVAWCALFAMSKFSHGQIVQPGPAEPISAYYYNQPTEAPEPAPQLQPQPALQPQPNTDPGTSPSDVTVPPAFGGNDGAQKGGKGCDCGRNGILPCNHCGEAWTLFPSDNCHGVEIGGSAQIGYHTAGKNLDGTGLFNNRPNEVQLQQMWAYIEKGVDTGGCGWDWGFRMDYVYGTDGPNTQAFGNAVGPGGQQGWDNEWDNGGDYGHAIPQLYFEAGVNDWKFKIGHFYTIIGYEVVPAPDNFFYSKAVTMNNGEPFTHTGVLGEWAYNDCTTLYIGYVLGWDTGFDRDGGSAVIIGSSRQIRDDLTVTSAVIFGDFGFRSSGPAGGGAASDQDAYMSSTVIDWVISDTLEYVFQYDFQDDQSRLAPVGQAHAINQYLFYTVNDCIRLGVRGEWAKIGATERSNITLGVNYSPRDNIIFRPEVRWDFSNFVVPTDRSDTVLFGVDMIVTW